MGKTQNTTKEQVTKPKMKTPTRYDCKHLAFLVDFMNATQTSVIALTQSVSEETSVRNMLRNDNMFLSKARELITRQGYKLDVKYTERAQENNAPSVKINIKGVPKKTRNPNICFILDALEKRKMTLKELAERMGVSQGAVWGWVRVDDIRIAYLQPIGVALDMDLQYTIEPLQEQK